MNEDKTVSRINSFLLEQYNKPLTYKPEPSNSASVVGTNCYRKIYYEYFKVEKDFPTDERSAKIFEMGKQVEIMIMSWLKGIGEHIPYRDKTGEIPKSRWTGLPDPQFPISAPGWRIKKGYIDNVAISDGKLWLYEIKSSGNWKYKAMKEPQYEHKDQTAIYFQAFNDLLSLGEYSHIPELKGFEKAEGVKILYLNKDTSELQSFVLRGEELRNNVLKLDQKLRKANEYADLKKLPEKTLDKCDYCSFRKKCAKNWNSV